MTISFILRPLEIFYGHLIHFVEICYNFPRFGITDQEKSGNPVHNRNRSQSYERELQRQYSLKVHKNSEAGLCKCTW
jgi:hypothetical protein